MAAADSCVEFDEVEVLNLVAEFLLRKKFTKAVEAMKFEIAVRPKNACDPSLEGPTALEEMLVAAASTVGSSRMQELQERMASSGSIVTLRSETGAPVSNATEEVSKPNAHAGQDLHVAFEPASDKPDGLILPSPPPPGKLLRGVSSDLEGDMAAREDRRERGGTEDRLAETAETRGKPSVPSASAAGAVADGPTASAATEEPSAEEEAELYKEAEPLTTDDIAEAVAVPSNLPLDYTPETEKSGGAGADEDVDEYSDDDDVGFTRIYTDPEEFFASAEEFLQNHQELMLQCELAEEEEYATELERADLNRMFEQYKNTNQPGAKPAAVPKHIPTDEELLARLDPGGAPLSVPPVDAPPAAAAAVAAEPPEVPAVLVAPAEEGAVAKADAKVEPAADAEAEATADEVVAAAAAASQVASVEPYDAYDLKSMMLRYMEAGQYDSFDLRVIFERNRTGFEETKDYPIEINGIIAGQYQIVEYLGSAAFSKAVQCVDLRDGSHVCIKIIKNNKDFFDQSLDEIKLLKYLNAHDRDDSHHIVQLYEFFYHKEHLFIVCELLRDNLYEFSKFNRESGSPNYFNLPRLQKITKQCLHALTFIHSLYLIHCDLKPENILIKSYSRCEVKIIDFGSSCFITDHLSSYVQSRSYRAPEVILGMPYDQKIDIWSLGCILAELFTGNVLFQNDSVQTLLSRIVGILGPFDPVYLERGRYMHKFFTKDYTIYEKRPEGDGFAYVIPKRTSLRKRLGTDDKNFIEFVGWLLKVKPEERPTAAEAMNHPWLTQSKYEWPE